MEYENQYNDVLAEDPEVIKARALYERNMEMQQLQQGQILASQMAGMGSLGVITAGQIKDFFVNETPDAIKALGADLIGMPMDVGAMAMALLPNVGMNRQMPELPDFSKIPMSSDWLMEKMGGDPDSIGRMIGSLASPGPGELKALFGGLPMMGGIIKGGKKVGLPAQNRLLTTHNLTAGNLEKADKLGGIPMPSIGIVNPEYPISGYGDITLVGDEFMVKPGARNPVFPADAYSPRQPRADTIYNRVEKDKVEEYIGSVAGQDNAWRLPRDESGRGYVYHDGETTEGFSEMLKKNDYGKALYLKEKGMMPPMEGDSFRWKDSVRNLIRDNDLENDFIDWANRKPSDLGIEGKQMIRTGSNNIGRSTYRAETMENVLKEMRKDMAGADGSAGLYGAGHLRAGVTPKFRNLKEIKAARGQIKSSDDLVDYKQAMNDQLLELVDEFKPYWKYGADSNPFIHSDNVMTGLTDAIGSNFSRIEDFEGVPDDLIRKARAYTDELKAGGTEYFEAKPMRAVGLDEFKVALVPEGADKKVTDVLEGKGLKVETYDGTEKGRKAALKRQTNLMYSALLGAVVAGGASQGYLNQNSNME